ncbi:Plug domain-containing protein [Stenotrophomonas sp. WED208]|uniref:TonB-dependent receptor plug domain-containing protein n=1 Tax=Stenotrophomonas sp. WED208 TaxID=3112800 RepID=UPI0034D4CCBC
MYRPLFARSRLSVALGSALMLVAAAPAMAQQAATQEQKAEPASSKTPVQLDRMTVTGSRIYRAGFDTLEPAAVVSRESIENYGDTNLIDAVTRIPGVSAGVSSRGDQAGFGAGVNFASKLASSAWAAIAC